MLTRALAVAATWLYGPRCVVCDTRTRRMVAHCYLDHGDEATT